MKVSRYNESWVSGASEICIRAKLICHNGRYQGIAGAIPKEYKSDQYSNYRGKQIKKVKRKDIKNQTLLTVNYPLQTNWQHGVAAVDPVYFIYTIFESDKFPATNNEDTRYALTSLITNEPAPPEGFKLWFRANEKDGNNWPYAKYHFTNVASLAAHPDYYAGSGYVNGYVGGLEFNTVIY